MFSSKPKAIKYDEKTLLTYDESNSVEVKAEKARQWFETIYYPQLLTEDEREWLEKSTTKMVKRRQFNEYLSHISGDMTLAQRHTIMYNNDTSAPQSDGVPLIAEFSLPDVYTQYIKLKLSEETIRSFDNSIKQNRSILENALKKYKDLLENTQSEVTTEITVKNANLVAKYEKYIPIINEGVSLITQYESKNIAKLRPEYKPYMISQINKVLEYVKSIRLEESQADQVEETRNLENVNSLTSKYHALSKIAQDNEEEAKKLEEHPAYKAVKAATDARVNANKTAEEAAIIKTKLDKLSIDKPDTRGGKRKSKRRKFMKRRKVMKRTIRRR